MLGRCLFLASLVKGLQAHPRPRFWTGLWVFYLIVIEYSWTLALGNWKPVLAPTLIQAMVAYLVFYLMVFFQDDGRYWAVLGIGGFLLIAIVP